MDKPEPVSRVEYVKRTSEHLVFTDEYVAVVNLKSVLDEQKAHIVGELSGETDVSGDEVKWGRLPYEVRSEVSSYVLNSTTDKGNRNEREAANLLGCVRGSGNVAKVNSYSNHDPFRFVDVIGIGGDWEKILFVQVKTNSFSQGERRKYRREMRRVNFDVARFEVWVRVDYQGWRVYEYSPGIEEFELVLEMETADFDETVEALREREGYYEM